MTFFPHNAMAQCVVFPIDQTLSQRLLVEHFGQEPGIEDAMFFMRHYSRRCALADCSTVIGAKLDHEATWQTPDLFIRSSFEPGQSDPRVCASHHFAILPLDKSTGLENQQHMCK